MTKWKYYKAGDEIWGAGVEILEMVEAGFRMVETWYNVRFMCCGREETIDHSKIRRRIRRQVFPCRVCGHAKSVAAQKDTERPGPYHGKDRANRDFPPLEFPLPTWDPPKLRPPKGWVPYRGSGRR